MIDFAITSLRDDEETARKHGYQRNPLSLSLSRRRPKTVLLWD